MESPNWSNTFTHFLSKHRKHVDVTGVIKKRYKEPLKPCPTFCYNLIWYQRHILDVFCFWWIYEANLMTSETQFYKYKQVVVHTSRWYTGWQVIWFQSSADTGSVLSLKLTSCTLTSVQVSQNITVQECRESERSLGMKPTAKNGALHKCPTALKLWALLHFVNNTWGSNIQKQNLSTVENDHNIMWLGQNLILVHHKLKPYTKAHRYPNITQHYIMNINNLRPRWELNSGICGLAINSHLVLAKQLLYWSKLMMYWWCTDKKSVNAVALSKHCYVYLKMQTIWGYS